MHIYVWAIVNLAILKSTKSISTKGINVLIYGDEINSFWLHIFVDSLYMLKGCHNWEAIFISLTLTPLISTVGKKSKTRRPLPDSLSGPLWIFRKLTGAAVDDGLDFLLWLLGDWYVSVQIFINKQSDKHLRKELLQYFSFVFEYSHWTRFVEDVF